MFRDKLVSTLKSIGISPRPGQLKFSEIKVTGAAISTTIDSEEGRQLVPHVALPFELTPSDIAALRVRTLLRMVGYSAESTELLVPNLCACAAVAISVWRLASVVVGI
jgi:hypothetical protein